MKTATKTSNKRIAWKSFDHLLTCFRNDPRRFSVTEIDAKEYDHPMSISNMILFWDRGATSAHDMQMMIDILLTASSLSVGEVRSSAGWIIKRTA
jgi:hypothetical protein